MTKPNKLTPGSNLLWESSRMILPEHREAILAENNNRKRKTRPELDEQKIEEIERVLQYSLQYRAEIELVLFGMIENRLVRGKVTWIDRLQIKFATAAGGFDWVESRDIVEVKEPF